MAAPWAVREKGSIVSRSRGAAATRDWMRSATWRPIWAPISNGAPFTVTWRSAGRGERGAPFMVGEDFWELDGREDGGRGGEAGEEEGLEGEGEEGGEEEAERQRGGAWEGMLRMGERKRPCASRVAW